MRGAGHTSYSTDNAQRDRWKAEFAARPELAPEQLLGLFSPDLIARLDNEQQKRASESIHKVIGFTALEGATKDEQRLMNIATKNMADYGDGEDIIYEDPILAQLIEPSLRYAHSGDEQFSNATRLRRTVVAYYLLNMHYDLEHNHTPENGKLTG